MNLHTTLKAYNEANVSIEQNLVLNEANSIIQQSAVNELKILETLGMDKNLREFDRINLENKQASKFDEIYDISVIEKMAIDYGLRFLPSNLYKGTIDPILPSVLNRFVEKHSIEPSQKRQPYERKEESNFYIIAPKSSFELQQRPKDPIIFYKINKNKYAFVHKWGNDLSPYRKLLYFPVRDEFTFIITCFLVSALIALLAINIPREHLNNYELFFSILSFGGMFGSFTGCLFGMGGFQNSKWNDKYI